MSNTGGFAVPGLQGADDDDEPDDPRSYSGLNAEQRKRARRLILKGCRTMMKHIGAIHYTQGGSRWSGINEKKKIKKGQYPSYADCSSMATWLLWNVLYVPYKIKDIVTGANWTAGYTGTISQHGKQVRKDSNIKVGDLILYGSYPYSHVTIAIGNGQCFSHGSEAGPYVLGIDYRDDRAQVRRFL
jgi:hypothetical protein